MDKIDVLANIIKNSENIVFFGGAGVSCESGIPDFRGSNGLYKDNFNNIPVEMVLSHSFFIKHPQEFYRFYRNKMVYKNALPNFCHKALVELENRGKLKMIITQNIDDLHIKAGSKNCICLHGSIFNNHCTKCHSYYDLDYVLSFENVPKCKICQGIIKPDVVLYEESLDSNDLYKAINSITNCDTLIIGGTSLTVYPASGLINYFNGKNLVIINKSTSSFDDKATLVINDNIGKVMNEVMKKLNYWIE